MKLELKHLAPYLPYGLNGFTRNANRIIELKPSNISYFTKPILRPLSDLTKEIEHKGRKFVPYNELIDVWGFEHIERAKQDKVKLEHFVVKRASYYLIEKLFEWNFDVFGLIPQGLAIDINTLKE